ncbi:hypothetical protein AB9N12_07580 [Bacteroides sp. AN502(2024)]|uniref:hypothetical protein n=1 Tax=Bacteroides sp. AN502(2024) TaxID=3160599 RepID=UPI003516BE17
MKKLVYCISLISLLLSCSEESLENEIDFSTPYEIQDDPNDPIQHRCYELYRDYGVCVFFKDTIQANYIGTDRLGNPVYRYETLDLNWDFTSHNGKTVTYKFDYLEEDEEKEKALRFADSYLKQASPSMRPFCIFLPKQIRQYVDDKITTPERHSTFRVLAINAEESKLLESSDEEINEMCLSIISETVLSRVKQNSDLTARFYSISDKEGYYGKYWKEDLGYDLPYAAEPEGANFGPNSIFNEDAFTKSCSPNPYSILYPGNGWTLEKFEETRVGIIKKIGEFGFISGESDAGGIPMSHMKSPKQADDLEFFVTTMLDLGESKFKERYGGSPLVMKKYTMLAEYIINTLKVELNKQ